MVSDVKLVGCFIKKMGCGWKNELIRMVMVCIISCYRKVICWN